MKDFETKGPGAPQAGGSVEAAPKTDEADEAVEEDLGKDPDREQIQVVLLERNGKVQMVRVKSGISDDFRVEIADGIKPGDHVILGPYRRLRSLKNGDLVQRVERSELGKEDEGS